jgi:hypothetical protein
MPTISQIFGLRFLEIEDWCETFQQVQCQSLLFDFWQAEKGTDRFYVRFGAI